jgi:hypothetical protein
LFLALALLWGYAFSLRNVVADLAFGKSLFGKNASTLRLEQLHTDTQIVFCATEMHSGQHTFFSPHFVYNRAFGLGVPGTLKASTAVQCSANFPVGFPFRLLLERKYKFLCRDTRAWRHHQYSRLVLRGRPGTPERRDPSAPPRNLALSDGGVFDNLAADWYLELPERLTFLRCWPSDEGTLVRRLTAEEEGRRGKQLQAMDQPPDYVIVLNGSPGARWAYIPTAMIPWLHEGAGIFRTMAVLYENMTRSRIEDLRARLRHETPHGVVVDIGDRPNLTAEALLDGETTPEEPSLDRAGIRDFLGAEGVKFFQPYSSDLFGISQSTPTTLRPLGVKVTASILYHAYCQAMLTLHAALGSPIIRSRDVRYFERLVSPGSSSAPGRSSRR